MFEKATKCIDYHKILDTIFSDLRACQGVEGEGGILANMFYKGATHYVYFKIPVAFVIGDCEGNDRLCGRFKSHNSRYLCRDCDCLQEDGDNTEGLSCIPTDESKMMALSKNNQLKSFSHYDIDNAFHKLWFGGDVQGIHGCTPPESLHVLQQGLHKYALSSFFELLKSSKTAIFEKAAIEMSTQCKRQSDRSFPRISLKKGASSITYMTAREQTGMLFVCCLTLCYKGVIESLAETTETALLARLYDFRNLFKELLFFEYWVESEFHSRQFVTDTQCIGYIQNFMRFYKSTIDRSQGNGLKIPKFHQLLHLPRYILKFGSPKNFNSGRMEALHIPLAKRPAKTAQKRKSVYEIQVALRISERNLVTRAALALQSGPATNNERFSQNGSAALGGSTFQVINTGNPKTPKYQACAVINLHKKRRNTFKDDSGLQQDVFIPFQSSLMNAIGPRMCGLVLAAGKSITCYTELCIKDMNSLLGGNFLFRAHPNYRQTGEWFDWACIEWCTTISNDDDSLSDHNSSNVDGEVIPCKFCCFVDLRNFSFDELTSTPDFSDGPGIYAVVESLVSAATNDARNRLPTYFLQVGSLDISSSSKLANYYFCKASSIIGPAFVIQLNKHHKPNEYHVVIPPSEWKVPGRHK